MITELKIVFKVDYVACIVLILLAKGIENADLHQGLVMKSKSKVRRQSYMQEARSFLCVLLLLETLTPEGRIL